MKKNYILTILFGFIWLGISFTFSLHWAYNLKGLLPSLYIWWVIIGIALFPGYLMSSMFLSNLLHNHINNYKNVKQNVSVIVCAYNEEANISRAIKSILNQKFLGKITLFIVNNESTDKTRNIIFKSIKSNQRKHKIKYLSCHTKGKSYALNFALHHIKTEYFITVDADTILDKNAIQRIINHISYNKSSCVAGNLFVKNIHNSIYSKMQNYDYLLSIAAIKRYQGSYNSTLVAQGAFSAYETNIIKEIGGWEDVLGEDIVLTYQILKRGGKSTYESSAVGYTCVPNTLKTFYNQRKRWGSGMIEGLKSIQILKLKNNYSKYFIFVNIIVIYMNLAYLFGFIPGVIFAIFGYYYFVSKFTIVALLISTFLFFDIYNYQKRLKIDFKNSLIGFILFILIFQTIQSMAAFHGYLNHLLKLKKKW